MECISTSFAPIIVQPDSGSDWAQQHILGEHIRLEQTKQTTISSSPLPSASISPASPRQMSPRQGAGRLRIVANNNTLQIPTSTTTHDGVQKPARPALKTPVKTGERTREEWEALLTGSIATLRCAYDRLEPPPAPRRQSLGEQRPDLVGLDRAEIASRALQAAAGCHVMFPAQMMTMQMMGCLGRGADVDGDSASDAGSSVSGDSLMSEDAPATPCEEMQIDPRLFS